MKNGYLTCHERSSAIVRELMIPYQNLDSFFKMHRVDPLSHASNTFKY